MDAIAPGNRSRASFANGDSGVCDESGGQRRANAVHPDETAGSGRALDSLHAPVGRRADAVRIQRDEVVGRLNETVCQLNALRVRPNWIDRLSDEARGLLDGGTVEQSGGAVQQNGNDVQRNGNHV